MSSLHPLCGAGKQFLCRHIASNLLPTDRRMVGTLCGGRTGAQLEPSQESGFSDPIAIGFDLFFAFVFELIK